MKIDEREKGKCKTPGLCNCNQCSQHGFSPEGENFLVNPDGVLMAGCWVCDWAILVPPVQYILRTVGAGGFSFVIAQWHYPVVGGMLVLCYAQSSQVVLPLKWSFDDRRHWLWRCDIDPKDRRTWAISRQHFLETMNSSKTLTPPSDHFQQLSTKATMQFSPYT